MVAVTYPHHHPCHHRRHPRRRHPHPQLQPPPPVSNIQERSRQVSYYKS
jgi:hypothetical protein